MKFATFVAQEREEYGLVLPHPGTGDLWVFAPEKVENALGFYAGRATSPFRVSRPRFLESRPWPGQLADFLALGDTGLSAARHLQDTLLRFLEQSDQALLAGCGFRLDEVTLRAPIPRPRLYFGLVQNSPSFWRNEMGWPSINLMPQGHQRPQGSVVGPGEVIYMAPEIDTFGWTPEFGIVIGRGGKFIPVTQAMQHVAGYTVTIDLAHNRYTQRLQQEAAAPLDWFEDATGSWLGKKSDMMGAMGPFVTTQEEVGNPYDLLIYTRQSGWQRDRAHTGAMVLGIERTISWLSSFLILYPGDVIHMATMAVDGMPITPEMTFGPDDYIEGEIEKVGCLRVPIAMAAQSDWRPADDPGCRIHPVPAVRDLIEAGRPEVTEPASWRLADTCHFWTLFGNYDKVTQVEGLAVRPSPRVLNCPARSLAHTGQPIYIPPRARTLSFGVELAFVVRKPARRVAVEEAQAYILGYLAMAVVRDSSFADVVVEPASPQVRNVPTVYARWPDGFNVVSLPPTPLELEAVSNSTMDLALDGIGSFQNNTDDYLLQAPRVLAFLSMEITLFPGDVVTLGRTHDLLTVPVDRALPVGTTLRAAIAGVGAVACPIVDGRNSKVHHKEKP